jgi:hypothetical protein
MTAAGPAGEKIVRNLQDAVARLHDDIARVELWAGALGSFVQPVPGYEPTHSRYALPQASHADSPGEPSERSGQRSGRDGSGLERSGHASQLSNSTLRNGHPVGLAALPER